MITELPPLAHSPADTIERITILPPTIRVSDQLDNDFYAALQQRLRHYNRQVAPQMEPPEAIPLNIRVEDESGRLLGGIAAVTYWDWLVIKLFVLDDEQRGNRLGESLLRMVHREAQARGCRHAQTQSYDFQALDFYVKLGYRVVGELKDYPTGYNYYWLRTDFDDREG